MGANNAMNAAIAAPKNEPLVMGAKIAPMPRLKLKHGDTRATAQNRGYCTTAEGGESIRKNLLQYAQKLN